MIGRTLGHYRIVEKIGKGGMGEVYRARDEHLNRDVAVKVLPPGTLADDAARKRFHKEALALSKLNHPNIATVHDFDTEDGVDFLVMEHIAGVTLAEKLAGGPLPEQEVARLGTEVAAALEEAHEHGVVHRDLKPRNIKVTPKGQVKVLDFGLARLLKPFSETGSTESLTETHALAGTLPYMAPEQLRGQPADARSDIWALGVVLYEAATGARPFQGGSGAEVSAAILRERPRAWPPRVPVQLQQVIERCLEKEPGRRYQRAGEVRAALEAVQAGTAAVAWRVWGRRLTRRQLLGAAGAIAALAALLVGLNVGQARDWLARLLGIGGPPRIDSLAVLPLKNLMGDPEQDYFVEGMHEALTAELSKISALKVISRTSAMRYQDTDKPMPQIAQELGVDALIEGSVQREADQVRITVQLIHGPTDRHLWAESYQRELRGVLALQSEVAQAIAGEIRIAVTPAERARLAAVRPANPDAYDAYLKGRYYMNSTAPNRFARAIEHFEQAIQKDPGFALAYAGLAEAYAWKAYAAAEVQKGKEAALKALELDETLAEAHASLGLFAHWFDWDWAAAERHFKRAIELNPNSAVAHHSYMPYLVAMRRFDEALRASARARELDPLSPGPRALIGSVWYYLRDYDRALKEWQGVLDIAPDSADVHGLLGLAYLKQGKYEEALAAARRAEELSGGDPGTDAFFLAAYLYGRTGERDHALRLLDELRRRSKEGYTPATLFVALYAGLGEKDQAFAWLEKAYQQREWLPAQLQVVPIVDPLRDDPRFQDLLRRMNFPE